MPKCTVNVNPFRSSPTSNHQPRNYFKQSGIMKTNNYKGLLMYNSQDCQPRNERPRVIQLLPED